MFFGCSAYIGSYVLRYDLSSPKSRDLKKKVDNRPEALGVVPPPRREERTFSQDTMYIYNVRDC